MIIILSITGIWPFGTKTILTSDLENQYVQFFSYLREIYKGNHSIFYTFSKTFGGEMLSLYAYYLMSPLNIILLFSEPNGSHRQLNFWFLSRSVSVVWHSTFWSVISVPVSDRLAWFFLFPTHWWLTIWHIFSIWCGWTVLFCFRSSYLAFTGFWKGIFLLFTHSVWALPFFLITISVLCCVFFLFFISVPSVQYRKSDWSVIFLYLWISHD